MLDARRPLILGHRGASAHARENTLAAFRLAREQGADGVELDARRTADGGWVVHHDAAIPGFGPISARTGVEIAAAQPWLPDLRAALEACAGMIVNLEIKNSPLESDWDPDDAALPAAIGTVAATSPPGSVLVSSFNLATIDRWHAADPETPTGWLCPAGVDVIDTAGVAAARGHRALHPDASLLAAPRPPIAAAHAAGLAVIGWTIDDPALIRTLAAAGIDGIITNDPAAARAALGGPA
jgi:glycerophosphoryl diester phosphodiesterase